MDERDRRALKSWRRLQGFRAAGFALALVCLLLLAFRMIVEGGAAFSTFEPLLALALMVWAGLLRGAPGAWIAAGRDLKSGAVETVRGRARLRVRRGPGLIAPMRATLLVDNRRFSVSDLQADHIIEGSPVTARFAARSGALLSVEEESARADEWPAAEAEPLEPLSDREADILRLIAQGLSDKEIARALGLSPATVRTYNTTLYAKLGVTRRTQAAPYAAKLGLTKRD